jgi:hypothetical protein
MSERINARSIEQQSAIARQPATTRLIGLHETVCCF